MLSLHNDIQPIFSVSINNKESICMHSVEPSQPNQEEDKKRDNYRRRVNCWLSSPSLQACFSSAELEHKQEKDRDSRFKMVHQSYAQQLQHLSLAMKSLSLKAHGYGSTSTQRKERPDASTQSSTCFGLCFWFTSGFL